MLAIEDKDLIKQFVEISYALKSSVAEQSLQTAKQRYQELYSVYHKINDSKLEKVHKEVAYNQLVNSYHLIQELKETATAPTNMIAVAIVIIIVSVIIFVNPRMIGLAIFQLEKNTAPIWNGEPQIITINGTTIVDFSQYFSDSNSDELVYMAIAPEGMRASVSGSIVTLEPEENAVKGEKMLEIIASDLKHSTRAKIKLIVVE